MATRTNWQLPTYHPIYTTGYAGRDARVFADMVHQMGAIVADVRYNPDSKMSQWKQYLLVSELGECYYRHVPEWGNKNYGTGLPIVIADEGLGLGRVLGLARTHPVILLCACSEFDKCHRRICSDLLRAHNGTQTQELSWPALPAAPGKEKALTIQQPHASLIFLPEGRRKLYETRSASMTTRYRGPLLIHAGKSKESLEALMEEPFRSAFRGGPFETAADLPFGAAIGIVELTDCIPTGAWCQQLPEPARSFGDFGPNRCAWKLENPRLFPAPVPMRGYQGLFDAEIDLDAALHAQTALHGEIAPTPNLSDLQERAATIAEATARHQAQEQAPEPTKQVSLF